MQQYIPNRSRVLTDDQIESFITHGFLVVRQVFSPALARHIVPMVWAGLGLNPVDRSGWQQPMITLEQIIESPSVCQMYASRYLGMIDDLCGQGRWRTTSGAGYWPILFPGFSRLPWQPPQNGWHVDGLLERNRFGAPGRGLITLGLFTLIEPGDGGTVIRVGSHRDAARVLWEAEPEGLSEIDFENQAGAASDRCPIHEVTGQAGDVLLMHPYTVHASSANTGSRVRIIGDKPVWLHELLNVSGTRSDSRSPVERAVMEALAIE